MDIHSLCSLRASGFIWQPRAGTYTQTLIVKATFQLKPDISRLAADQEALNEEDNHWNDDSSRSVVAPSDWAPFKPRADVMLVGHVFAPGQQPARAVTARMVIGEIDKSIEVWCDRGIRLSDGQLLEGPRFTKMPLRWERAAGGPSTSNPVGMRFDAPPDKYGMVAVPNLQPSGIYVSGRSDTFGPVCFGPLGAEWPSRVAKLGRLGAAFFARGWERQALPDGVVDYEYFQAAPEDQQMGAIRANERIVLENLHPEHARLVTSLPGVLPRAVAERGNGTREELSLAADTLWIDTDRGICTVLWRGRVALRDALEAGRIVVSMEEEAPVSLELELEDELEPTKQPGGGRKNNAELASMTMVPGLGIQAVVGSVMPFGGNAGASFKEEARRPAVGDSVLPFGRGGGVALGNMASPAAPAPPLPPPPVVAPPPVVMPPAPVESGGVAALSSPWARGGDVVLKEAGPAPAIAGPAVDSKTGAAGALGASNAALAAAAWSIQPSPKKTEALSLPQPASKGRVEIRDNILQLLWFDPEILPRLRRKTAIRTLLRELQKQPVDTDLGDPTQADAPGEIEDRRDIFDILAQGETVDMRGMYDALHDAIRQDGKFIPAIALAQGELAFGFDELEALKATLTSVTPLITPADEALQRTCEMAKTFLQTPGLLSGPAVAEGLMTRIKDAFGQGKRVVSLEYVEGQTEIALLNQRHYKKRRMFGGPQIRALLHLQGESTPVPVYLPQEITDALPLYQRFRARLVVEIHLQADQGESHAMALRGFALGRLAPVPRR